MSFVWGDEVPQISTRKPLLLPLEFLRPSAKRLLQHYRRKAAVPGCPVRANVGLATPNVELLALGALAAFDPGRIAGRLGDVDM